MYPALDLFKEIIFVFATVITAGMFITVMFISMIIITLGACLITTSWRS